MLVTKVRQEIYISIREMKSLVDPSRSFLVFATIILRSVSVLFNLSLFECSA